MAPFDPSGYVDLAYLRTMQDRFKEAAELLERAVAAKPDHHENWLKLGFARARAGTGDVAGAVARFRGGKPSPRDELKAARALALSGDVAAAARLVEEIHSKVAATITADSAQGMKAAADADHYGEPLFVAEAWRIAGAAALARGEMEKAERFLAPAWDLGTLPEAAVDLGRLREKQGRLEDAIALWQRASFLRVFRGNPARKELERVVKDPARRAALIRDAPQEQARFQVQSLAGPAPPSTVEVRVRMLADENGRVLDVVSDAAGDAAKLAPLRDRVIGVTLPGKSPDGVAFNVMRAGTLTCFATSGCQLGLVPLGEAVTWKLEY
jgi:tetratricopeptide (TPR) repeat protein